MEIFMANNAVLIDLSGLHEDLVLERHLVDSTGDRDSDSGSLSTVACLVAMGLIALAFTGCFLM